MGLIIDLHVHTRDGSSDSLIEAASLPNYLRDKRLNGIAITEHDNQPTPGLVSASWTDSEFIFIAGIEIRTEVGDIIAFGLDEYSRELSDSQTLKKMARNKGAFLIAAHPFRRDFSPVGYGGVSFFEPHISLESAVERPIFSIVDAIEVMNGSSTAEEIDFSLEVSRLLGLRKTAGSDAHSPRSLGGCVTVFPERFANYEEFLELLRSGDYWVEDRREHPERGSC